MRPPNKSRSRNKNNRRNNNNNNAGNSLNRVYDSAGPQGRVRGTPAQVIEKYQSLAHDSSLAGDRVALENFQQHAEHYIRLMNEAQRQIAERREAQEQNRQNQDRQQQERQPDPAPAEMSTFETDPGAGEQPNLVEPTPPAPSGDATGSNAPDDDKGKLVATPEEQKPKPPRQRRPRPKKPADKPAETPAEPNEGVQAAD